jgi:hypothetical protein
MLLVSAVGLVALSVSGVLHGIAEVGLFHRWLAHGTFIFNGLTATMICGVLVQMRQRNPSVRLTLGIVLLVLLVFATWLGAVTGYLEPSGEDLVAQETRNRFIVLHFFFFPACIAALLAATSRVVWSDRVSEPVKPAVDINAATSKSP